MSQVFQRTTLLAVALGAAGLGGCAGHRDDDGRYDKYGRSRDYENDVRVREDRYERRDAPPVDRDPSTARKVPKDARVVDEGRGSVSYGARGNGEVYLLDDTAGVVIWDAKVQDGDRVWLYGAQNRITVNDKEQAKIEIQADHHFKLYFLPTGRM